MISGEKEFTPTSGDILSIRISLKYLLNTLTKRSKKCNNKKSHQNIVCLKHKTCTRPENFKQTLLLLFVRFRRSVSLCSASLRVMHCREPMWGSRVRRVRCQVWGRVDHRGSVKAEGSRVLTSPTGKKSKYYIYFFYLPKYHWSYYLNKGWHNYFHMKK